MIDSVQPINVEKYQKKHKGTNTNKQKKQKQKSYADTNKDSYALKHMDKYTDINRHTNIIYTNGVVNTITGTENTSILISLITEIERKTRKVTARKNPTYT